MLDYSFLTLHSSFCQSNILEVFVCQLLLLPFSFFDVIGRAKKHSQPGVLMGKGGRK